MSIKRSVGRPKSDMPRVQKLISVRADLLKRIEEINPFFNLSKFVENGLLNKLLEEK